VFLVLLEWRIQQRLWGIVPWHVQTVLKPFNLSFRAVSQWVRRNVEWVVLCLLFNMHDWAVLELLRRDVGRLLSVLRVRLFERNLLERLWWGVERNMPAVHYLRSRRLPERMRRNVERSVRVMPRELSSW
jgi:hypothetical protein